MENRRHSKYDIPLIIVDTRENKRESFRSKKDLRKLSVDDKEKVELLPNLELLFTQFIQIIQKPLIALKYRFFKKLDSLFEDVDVPWLKIIALSLVAFMAFKKDIQFNLSFNAPTEGFSDDRSQDDQLVKNTTFGAAGNPYAPVSAHSLADKKALAFIKKYAATAQSEMKKYGIPASIKMAQALIESNAGNSRLAKNNNNHFGIKCFSRNCKKGHCTNATDDHHKDFFRKYPKPEDSWRSHSNLLMGKRYKGLHAHGTNYKAWAQGLKKAGYATDKRYDKKLINTIEKFKLYKLDAQN